MHRNTMPALVPTTKLLLIFLLPLLLLTLDLPPRAEAGSIGQSWRYLFPFFPAELDILQGHLRTTVIRLEEVLKQCEDMIEGDYKGDENPIGVHKLSADKNGNGQVDTTMEQKVDQILELREVISKLEDKIEECRFRFWTGAEKED